MQKDTKPFWRNGIPFPCPVLTSAWQSIISIFSSIAYLLALLQLYMQACTTAAGVLQKCEEGDGATRILHHIETRGCLGCRFKAKKGAGGDTKGSSKVEPYAYWPMDRRMLNRRPDKKREARAGLAGVVKASKKASNQESRAKQRKISLPPAASL